jgi:hypothetical protein
VTSTVSVPNSVAAGFTAAPVAAATGRFVAGPGVPSPLVADHNAGKTVVLFISDQDGIEDAMVREAVHSLRSDPRVAVYETGPMGIARYAGITQGVGVTQVPALVVVSPHEVGGVPKASVSYGFRGNGSVKQAVRDAVYRGATRGYDPG